MPKKTPEALLQDAVLTALEFKKVFHFRIHQSNARATAGGVQHVQVHTPGLPDLVAFTPDGHPWALELKSAKGRLSAAQEAVREAWTANGGTFLTIRSLDDLAPLFDRLKSLSEAGVHPTPCRAREAATLKTMARFHSNARKAGVY